MTIFLHELCGLGGIYGDAETGLNKWDKGSVAFVPPGQRIRRKVRVGDVGEWVE